MGNNLQKIILYLTINTENLKFYVGLHECDPDVYDYYLGDGCYANDPSTYNRRKLPLAFAIRSNGVSKFKRIILGVYDNMKDPVVVEHVKAKAGLDIGCTLIGMHLKDVAVPLRLTVKTIGCASVNAAYTRPKLIGGIRAHYPD